MMNHDTFGAVVSRPPHGGGSPAARALAWAKGVLAPRPALNVAGLLLLTACAAPIAPDAPGVRHAGSTVPYGRDGRWHLFVFDPATPRPLEDRLKLARAAIASDPDCTWLRAPRAEILAQTQRQGARFAETTVAAPLRCDR